MVTRVSKAKRKRRDKCNREFAGPYTRVELFRSSFQSWPDWAYVLMSFGYPDRPADFASIVVRFSRDKT